MEQKNSKKTFVVCIKNEGYVASLELRKIYEVIPDERAAEHQMIRVVDESGEDYLYPSDFFIPIDLPKPVEQALALAMRKIGVSP
ncbi:MAG: hypothetical protein JRI71_04550 [Deltaproteobacteria bacterium]|nr:hypothetical protein [Deltaproteobacteria bacterium]